MAEDQDNEKSEENEEDRLGAVLTPDASKGVWVWVVLIFIPIIFVLIASMFNRSTVVEDQKPVVAEANSSAVQDDIQRRRHKGAPSIEERTVR